MECGLVDIPLRPPGAQELWIVRVAEVVDFDAIGSIGDADEAVTADHIMGDTAAALGAHLLRLGRIGDIDDMQESAGIAGIEPAALEHDTGQSARKGECPGLNRIGGIGHIEDQQAFAAVGHIGQSAADGDILDAAAGIIAAGLDRGGRIGNVDQTEPPGAAGQIEPGGRDHGVFDIFAQLERRHLLRMEGVAIGVDMQHLGFVDHPGVRAVHGHCPDHGIVQQLGTGNGTGEAAEIGDDEIVPVAIKEKPVFERQSAAGAMPPTAGQGAVPALIGAEKRRQGQEQEDEAKEGG